MSLIICPDCNHQVSDKAIACPSCGYPIQELFNANSIDDFQIENGVLKKYIGVNRYANIPKTVTSIGDDAFNQSDIIAVTIPETVTAIGRNSFYKCENLSHVEIPNSVKTLGNNAFAYCKNLSIISIPETIESIGNGTFRSCNALKYSLHGYVRYLGNKQNPYLVALKLDLNRPQNPYITIKKECRFIHSGAFEFATISGLSFEAVSNLKTICSDAFNSCTAPSLRFPNSLCDIQDHVFASSKIRYIELSNNIDYIPYNAFYNSKVESIVIPEKVTEIENGAFLECKELKEVYIHENVKKIHPNSLMQGTFNYCDNLCIFAHRNSYAAQFAIENNIRLKYF